MANITAEVLFGGKLFEETVGPFGATAGFDYSMPDLTFRASNSTVPAGHEVWSGILALTAGALTIDLTTSLLRSDRTVLNLTGKRILFYRIDNLGAAILTFLAPVTNPYAMFPATPGKKVGIGATDMHWEPAGFGTVGASNLAIGVTGTGTDTFRLGLIAGNP